MSKSNDSTPSILRQFRSFCFQNKVKDVEKGLEYFAVFGGMGWSVDMSKSLDELIETKVLKNYRYIHGDITKVTHSKPKYHAMLTAIATGDRREHSSFKKVNVGREEGEEIIDFLIKDGFVKFDNSVEKPVNESDGISDKLLFLTPFMRFWFAVVSPHYKSIKAGEYDEFKKKFEGIRAEFTSLIYVLLVRELFLLSFKDAFEGDPIISVGSYYDKHVEVDILAKRKSGALLAGSVKLGKQKMNKSELTKLIENCKNVELDVESYVLFSKNKFSSELKKVDDVDVKLFSLRHLSKLIENLSEDELLHYTNKKY